MPTGAYLGSTVYDIVEIYFMVEVSAFSFLRCSAGSWEFKCGTGKISRDGAFATLVYTVFNVVKRVLQYTAEGAETRLTS